MNVITMAPRYKTRCIQLMGVSLAVVFVWSAFFRLPFHDSPEKKIDAPPNVIQRELRQQRNVNDKDPKLPLQPPEVQNPPPKMPDVPKEVPKEAPAPRVISPRPGLKHSLWIVLTTIQSPTDQVKALAKIPGWQLVVVADTKTPTPWSTEGAIFLSIEDQKQLGYSILDIVPYKNYARKNIGYIFAIQHGATYIYETDDDNIPTLPLESFFMSPNRTTGLVVNTDKLAYNPCPHFGQSSLWPRGYPLAMIGITEPHEYTLSEIGTPPIQQGFVDGDPDLDALYRLTRKHTSQRLDLTFDKAAPPVVLPAGTFAPMNSQNTLFTTKALWAMLLPFTVTMRVTDIYRAYWGERLLWLYGERVAFFPPNAYQVRSPHSYLDDAKLEVEMYHHTEELLNYLKSWECKSKSLPECAVQMSQGMADKKFWGQADADQVAAWFKDLKAVGYEPPPIPVQQQATTGLEKVTFYANEQNTSWAYSPQRFFMQELTNIADMEVFIKNFCGIRSPTYYAAMKQAPKKHKATVLVVGVNNIEGIQMLDAYNRQIIPNTIYCSTSDNKPFFLKWRLSHVQVKEKPTAFNCLKAASRMRHLVAGYLYIPPDMLLEQTNMIKADLLGVPWLQKITPAATEAQPDAAARNTIQRITNGLHDKKIGTCFQVSANSAQKPNDGPIYIPHQIGEELSSLDPALKQIDDHVYFHFILGCTQPKVERFTSVSFVNLQSAGATAHYINPFVFSITQTDSNHKRQICSPFLTDVLLVKQ